MSSIEIALLIILVWVCVYSIVSVICKTYKEGKLAESFNTFLMEWMENKEDDESTREK